MTGSNETGRWPAPRYTVTVTIDGDVETYGVFRDLRAAARHADRIREAINPESLEPDHTVTVRAQQIQHAHAWKDRWSR